MRKTFGIVAVVSAFISLFAFSYAEIGVCSHYYKHEQKFFYYCGWLWNKKCTRYVQYSEQLSIYCCTGYQHYPNCYPVCDGKTILNDACNEQYYSDVIVYRGGETRDRGGGSCSSPENCTNCADGFYGDSGRCLICPSIVNCNHRRCTSSSDNYCEYCQYEIKDRRSWRGYTRHFDGEMKQCKS
ncbi:uncharacterized protein LOC143046854 [Mytilus galloprovincialis]|uniref:uncharacterized protein LOC143046854 n=1 Tax=Mytilus galloprovincialis TaxID=29158 RepID=UPI003F7B81A9